MMENDARIPGLRRWRIGPSLFTALPETGARLLGWSLSLARGARRQILHEPEVKNAASLGDARGGNPVLFPFCGRSFHQGREGWWLAPDKKLRPMPLHGFARGCRFKLMETREDGFTASLIPDPKSRESYPFDYLFNVSYRFEELALRAELRFENRDEIPLPWCAGHHFYFRLPWHTGAKRGDYRILIPAKKAFYHAAGGRLSPVQDFAPEESFAAPGLNDRIHTHLKENRARFGPRSGEEDVSIEFGDAPVPAKDNTAVTWTESPEAPYYCVEPWMGPPNSPGLKKGLRRVAPGESDSFKVRVSLL